MSSGVSSCQALISLAQCYYVWFTDSPWIHIFSEHTVTKILRKRLLLPSTSHIALAGFPEEFDPWYTSWLDMFWSSWCSGSIPFLAVISGMFW